MSDDNLVLYTLPPSPNNMKARIALNYKGLAFDAVEIDVADMVRAQVVEVSGQPLTPVLKHGDTVVFDSGAILRYLDGNFPVTPKLFFAERPRMVEAERLENWARYDLSSPIGTVFEQAQAENPDLQACGAASEHLHGLTAEIESRLGDSEWLMGDAMSAVDVTAAPWVLYGMVPAAVARSHPIAQFFHDNLHLGDGREQTQEWVGRVMAFNA